MLELWVLNRAVTDTQLHLMRVLARMPNSEWEVHLHGKPLQVVHNAPKADTSPVRVRVHSISGKSIRSETRGKSELTWLQLFPYLLCYLQCCHCFRWGVSIHTHSAKHLMNGGIVGTSQDRSSIFSTSTAHHALVFSTPFTCIGTRNYIDMPRSHGICIERCL